MVIIIKKQTLETSLWLPKPRENIFPFFSDAFNLELLTPSFLKFKVIGEIGIQSKIDFNSLLINENKR